ELSLLADGGEDRGAPILQLPQVGEPLLEGAQLRVVEVAGGLLPVSRDEGHRGALVEERHGGRDLGGARAELDGDRLEDPGGGGVGRGGGGDGNGGLRRSVGC